MNKPNNEIEELKTQLAIKEMCLESYRGLSNSVTNKEWDEVAVNGIIHLSVQIAQIKAKIRQLTK